MITFRVNLPTPLAPGEEIFLTVLDEVTGLAFNKEHHSLEAEDAQTYFIILPFPVQHILKYRYERQGSYMAQEHLSDGRAVRYRLYQVQGPGFVQDTIARWTDTPYTNATGRILGTVRDAVTQQPIANLLVTAGGMPALTGPQGQFLLEGMPPGTHNLVVYAQNGGYNTYQQGAVVAAGSATMADIFVHPAQWRRVVFTVQVPESTPPEAQLRLAGNLIGLGNTFSDLTGGVNTLADRMPILSRLPDGRFSTSLNLPVGVHLQYKYTLGDGIWNAEHDLQGHFVLRHCMILTTTAIIEDQVASWGVASSQPLTFQVTVPNFTPRQDQISLQLNPGFSWLEPVPMWPTGENQWTFTLLSPLQGLKSLQYRYCRNSQCGSADEANSTGLIATGRSIALQASPQTLIDQVSQWAWLSPEPISAVVPSQPIQTRQPGFIAGIALQPGYHPSWIDHFEKAREDIFLLSPNWVFLSSNWSLLRQSPPVFDLIAGQDVSWNELQTTIRMLEDGGVQVGLIPRIQVPKTTTDWWQQAGRDFAWWVSWFDRYQVFLLDYAILAEQTSSAALVLGEPWINPALPGGVLQDGAPSGVPPDAEERWRMMLQTVRAHYHGQILWMLNGEHGLENPPPFLDLLDQIYLVWSPDLSRQGAVDEATLREQAGMLLDEKVKTFQEAYQKPIILVLAYPSATGALNGCILAENGTSCLDHAALERPNPDLVHVSVDLQAQAMAYNANLMAINNRDWIQGVVSQGYYPAAILQDKSESVHGKPASGVLWYWFPRLLGEK